jgi:site-specific recombinase
LHLAVATKQPAMTANAIAAALDAPRLASRGGNHAKQEARERFDALVKLVARTVRTQIAAVIGNIAIALPTAAAIASAIWWWTGSHFVSPAKAMGLLQGLHPFASGALAYAALAGVCLFLAGLIAGFYDNLGAYNRIPQRLLQLRAPARWLGQARWQALARYVENNLGALAGNFSLGFLLGGASGLGALLGLPLDVRHVTLTSAQWGFAMTALNDTAPWPLAVMAALGVGLIGMINLGVSFSLALWIALKSRGITVAQGKVALSEIARGFWRHPREFFLPPKPRAKSQAGPLEDPLLVANEVE